MAELQGPGGDADLVGRVDLVDHVAGIGGDHQAIGAVGRVGSVTVAESVSMAPTARLPACGTVSSSVAPLSVPVVERWTSIIPGPRRGDRGGVGLGPLDRDRLARLAGRWTGYARDRQVGPA